MAGTQGAHRDASTNSAHVPRSRCCNRLRRKGRKRHRPRSKPFSAPLSSKLGACAPWEKARPRGAWQQTAACPVRGPALTLAGRGPRTRDFSEPQFPMCKAGMTAPGVPGAWGGAPQMDKAIAWGHCARHSADRPPVVPGRARDQGHAVAAAGPDPQGPRASAGQALKSPPRPASTHLPGRRRPSAPAPAGSERMPRSAQAVRTSGPLWAPGGPPPRWPQRV